MSPRALRWIHRAGYLTTALVVLELGGIAYLALGGYVAQKIEIYRAAWLPDEPFEAQRKFPRSTQYFPSAFRKPSVICRWQAGSRPEAIVDDFMNDWFSKHLAAAGEPSLYLESRNAARPGGTTVRLTWLRSFDPGVFIRVSGLGTARVQISFRQLSGAGGYDPGVIAKQFERKLTEDEARSLSSTITSSHIFTLPPIDCNAGCDGAEWVIEGIDDQGYHFLRRWSPQDGAVHDLGLALIKLTGQKYDRLY